jgi:lipid A 3-O-deacylase
MSARPMLAASLVYALLWTPASAADLYGGVMSHGAPLGITVCCFEKGVDVELGAMTGPVKDLDRWGSLKLYGLLSANTGGGVDFAAAGLAWRIPLGGRFYLQPGLGGAVQDGSTVGFQKTPGKLYLGSRYLFEPQGSLGWQATPHWAVEAAWVHLSHAHLAGPQNPGLDDLGLRAVYRFG